MNISELDFQQNQSTSQTSQSHTECCVYSNKAPLICINKNCLQDAFVCMEEKCKCNNDHFKCPKMLISSITQPIQAKISSLTDIQNSILERIDKTIDQLSDFRQKLSVQMKRDLEFHGLTLLESKFYCCLTRSIKEKVTGQQVFRMFSRTMNDEKYEQLKKPFEDQFCQSWHYLEGAIKMKTKEILDLLESLNIKNELDHFSILTPKIFKDSKIILGFNDEQKLTKMFQPQHVDSSKLLYRASQNNFSIDSFHQKCDNISHTLTICQTEYGKVIGGYTPLVWKKQSTGAPKDQSGLSFIFSLTNNHKFKLNKEKTAIFRMAHNQNNGPTFGDMNPDFSISNKANQTRKSFTRINRSYVNQSYVNCNPESYQLFNGDPQKSFNYKAKQWEVWEVKFKPE